MSNKVSETKPDETARADVLIYAHGVHNYVTIYVRRDHPKADGTPNGFKRAYATFPLQDFGEALMGGYARGEFCENVSDGTEDVSGEGVTLSIANDEMGRTDLVEIELAVPKLARTLILKLTRTQFVETLMRQGNFSVEFAETGPAESAPKTS